MTIRNSIIAGLSVAVLTLATPGVFAQEAGAAAPAPAEAAPAEAAPAEPATASPVGAAPAGQPGAAEAPVDPASVLPSPNWLKVCDDPLPNGQRACMLRQRVVIPSTGQFLGSFLLRDDPGQESRLLAVAAVPLGVMLPFGLTWQIDDSTPRRVPYMLCDPVQCATQLVINEAYINSLKRGNKLKLIAKTRQNEDLTVEIDLAGFTATYDGEGALSFEQFQQQATGANALEQQLQDSAESLRQRLEAEGGAAPAAPAEGATPPAQ